MFIGHHGPLWPLNSSHESGYKDTLGWIECNKFQYCIRLSHTPSRTTNLFSLAKLHRGVQVLHQPTFQKYPLQPQVCHCSFILKYNFCDKNFTLNLIIQYHYYIYAVTRQFKYSVSFRKSGIPEISSPSPERLVPSPPPPPPPPLKLSAYYIVPKVKFFIWNVCIIRCQSYQIFR